ncbi:MAG: 3-deoxy-D-manno-octulosonic acid transferase [Armatimonadota bacterium]
MSSILYNILLFISLPGAFVYYLWRVFVIRKSNESWKENLGFLPKFSARQKGKKLIWIHAASVGEVVASLPVQDELRKLVPDAVILVTTITQTGNSVARKSAKNADAVAYFPLDYPIFVNRALSSMKPDVFVMVETEMWPNFLSAVKSRGIPSLLINGRISDRSVRRLRHWRWLMSWAASKIDCCCMQTQVDADRILMMGADQKSVRVLGSTKFDQEGCQIADGTVRSLRTDLKLPEGVPVFVAGSTNPGEDEPVLDAFMTMRKQIENLRLIIAPRQLERTLEIQGLIESRSLKCTRRSMKETSTDDYDVMILDTFGELGAIYAIGQAAFVGGSLIPKGGHSIIQPILQGKPVFFGPFTFKTKDIAQMAVSAGVGFEVSNADELAATALAVMSDYKALAEVEVACRRLVSDNRGASGRCAELIVQFMNSRSEDSSAP